MSFMKYIATSLLVFFVVALIIPNAFAENVPDWVKNTAGWWATDQIDDSSFLQGIQFLIKEGIMVIPPTETLSSSSSQEVPEWIKNNAGWWANDKISEEEFVNAIQFLIKNGIISISNSLNEKYGLCDTNYELSTKFRENVKIEIKEQWQNLCSNFYNEEYARYTPWPSQGPGAYINEHGFRGPEIAKEKPVNTFRIFLVGGSTMFGSGSDDSTQIFSVLQERFDEKDFGFDIEVINAGISGAWSKNEVAMVKNKLLDFNPDLIVVYDGVNDISGHQEGSEIAWKDRWTEICNLGKKNGFDTIVILQPFNGSGFRVLTENDQEIFLKQGNFLPIDLYPLYSNQLQELNKNCKKAVDMNRTFDKIPGDLFSDSIHTGIRANQIIADNFYQVIVPVIKGTQHFESTDSNMNSKKDLTKLLGLENLEFNNVNFENLNLSGVDFSGRNLANTIFYNTNLDNVDFTNANLSGTNFLGGSIDGANFSGANIENANFIKTKLGDSNFTNAILDETLLYRLDFTNSNLSSTSIIDAKILDSSFKGMNLNGINFTNTDFHKVDLSYTNLDGLNLAGKDLSYSNLTGVNLSGKNLEGTNLTNSLLTDTNVTNAQLSNAIFADASGVAAVIYDREQYGSIISQQSDDIFERYSFFQWSCSVFLCTNEKGETATDGVLRILEGLKLIEELQYLYNQIGVTADPQNTAVLFPTISAHAFSKHCIWNYYVISPPDLPQDCYTVNMSNVDFTKPHPSNFNTSYFTEPNCYPVTGLAEFCNIPLSPFLIYNLSFKGVQALHLLGYTIISDLEIEKNPNMLSSYEKIIVLHNNYVTKTIFNAVTSHPKVVYLYPDSLKEEVSVNFVQNTITALSPLKHPLDEKFQNDFQWEYDSSIIGYVNCLDIVVKFEKVANGIMLNCYPEDFLTTSPSLFKIIKEF